MVRTTGKLFLQRVGFGFLLYSVDILFSGDDDLLQFGKYKLEF